MPTGKKPTAKKETAAKKAPTAKKTTGTRKPNAAFNALLTPSAELAAVVGSKPLKRTEVVSKLWDYIKKNNLQDPKNKKTILPDAKLKPILGGKSKVDMMEMAGLYNKHLSK